MKKFSLEFWLGFWVKINLELREAQGRQNEGKTSDLKNCLHQPFKTKNMCFSLINFLRSYSQKMPLKHKLFAGKHYSRDSHDLVTKVSVWNFVFSWFCLNPFSHEVLSDKLLAKISLKKFLMKNMKNAIKQKLKTQKHKNTFKNI